MSNNDTISLINNEENFSWNLNYNSNIKSSKSKLFSNNDFFQFSPENNDYQITEFFYRSEKKNPNTDVTDLSMSSRKNSKIETNLKQKKIKKFTKKCTRESDYKINKIQKKSKNSKIEQKRKSVESEESEEISISELSDVNCFRTRINFLKKENVEALEKRINKGKNFNEKKEQFNIKEFESLLELKKLSKIYTCYICGMENKTNQGLAGHMAQNHK
jgi:hypothetical protein